MNIRCLPASHVVSDSFDGDRVVIDIQTGAYYMLTPDAASLWSEASDVGEVDGDSDRLPVLMRLLQEGLLEAQESPNGVEPAPVESAFTRYTDMEELLLIDPIHEVDNEGWPVFRQPDA
jgi:hypothetical protein